MASVPFDTLKAYQELQNAGFDDAQARAVIATVGTAIAGNLATKDDVRDMATKDDIKDMATKDDIKDMATKTISTYQGRTWPPSRTSPASEGKWLPRRGSWRQKRNGYQGRRSCSGSQIDGPAGQHDHSCHRDNHRRHQIACLKCRTFQSPSKGSRPCWVRLFLFCRLSFGKAPCRLLVDPVHFAPIQCPYH